MDPRDAAGHVDMQKSICYGGYRFLGECGHLVPNLGDHELEFRLLSYNYDVFKMSLEASIVVLQLGAYTVLTEPPRVYP